MTTLATFQVNNDTEMSMYEERYLTTHIARYYYVCGADGNAAVYVSDPDVEEKAYCIDTDHLGSITALYDQYGTKCFSASYDVWGKRTVGISNVDFDRGFTGHEHIDEIGLINMNGRMYEPNLGRFISVDPYVQEPANSQNYNRYSYCLNNPLKYNSYNYGAPLFRKRQSPKRKRFCNTD